MALDRQSVEKKDFPIARRGYDPEAVDAFLAGLATEIEELQRQQAAAPRATGSGSAPAQPSGPASLALAASEQVRMIVEAAETSASEIEAAARDEAARIRAAAGDDAAKTREDAISRSAEHVGQVGDATGAMLQRVDAMESELGSLLESLRTGTNRLTADLSLLQGNMAELYGAAGGSVPAPPAPAPVAPAPVAPAPVAEPAAVEEQPEPAAPVPAPVEEDEPVDVVALAAQLEAESAAASRPAAAEPAGLFSSTAPEPAPAPAASSADSDAARLVALDMALNGQSREEIDSYLEANYDLADRSGLLDDVFESLGG